VSTGLACPECGHRQESGDRCTACGYDGVLHLDHPQHVDLLRDIDLRRLDKHEARVRMLSVGVAMALVFALWCVPGFWSARSRAFAMPFLADQWFLMIVIALGLTWVLKRTAPRPRFPYIEK
jgi:hypothetical protein